MSHLILGAPEQPLLEACLHPQLVLCITRFGLRNGVGMSANSLYSQFMYPAPTQPLRYSSVF